MISADLPFPYFRPFPAFPEVSSAQQRPMQSWPEGHHGSFAGGCSARLIAGERHNTLTVYITLL